MNRGYTGVLGAARGLVMHLGVDFILKLLEIFVRSVLAFGDNYLKHFRCYITTQPGEESCPILLRLVWEGYGNLGWPKNLRIVSSVNCGGDFMDLLSLTSIWGLGSSALYFPDRQSIENFVPPQSVFEMLVEGQTLFRYLRREIPDLLPVWAMGFGSVRLVLIIGLLGEAFSCMALLT